MTQEKPERFATKKASHFIQARPLDEVIHGPYTTLHLVGPLSRTRVL
jgi:hypothetical protein